MGPFDRDIGRQLVRCATSIGANYRAASRPRSAADMIAKLKLVEEECDESLYWLELLVDLGVLSTEVAGPLIDEGTQILKMTVASINTLRAKRQ